MGRARAGQAGHKEGTKRARAGHRRLPPLPHDIVSPTSEVPGQDGDTARSPWRGVPAPHPLRPLQLIDNSVTQHEVRVGGTLPRNEGAPG